MHIQTAQGTCVRQNLAPDLPPRPKSLPEGLRRPRHLLELGQTPFVLVLGEPVKERLDPFLSLALGDTRRIRNLEELGGDLG